MFDADEQVIQAVLITLGIFIGLTLFTFQTKVSTQVALFVFTSVQAHLSQLDFSSMYPFLFAGIWGMITASLVQIFIPFNSTVDLFIAGFGVVLFSGFILYDTQQIMKRVSLDEYVLAVCVIYTDVLALFLNILRIVSHMQNHRHEHKLSLQLGGPRDAD